jgi:NAD(P)-dependent dehydrogenase (short-subunit alcohol dehydrogenase family)
LGSAVSDAFLAANATVAAVARSIKPRAGSANLIPIQGDLETAKGAKNVVDEVIRQANKIDALIHVMGGFAGGKPLAETDDDTWVRMMAVNLYGALYVTRAVLPYMLKVGYGRIVAVGSRSGAEPSPGLSAYNASKAALHSLIQTVAKETLGRGITANVLMPSIIDTPANRAAMPDADSSAWVKPAAIAQMMVWLCSQEAGDTSGALIPVYGRS